MLMSQPSTSHHTDTLTFGGGGNFSQTTPRQIKDRLNTHNIKVKVKASHTWYRALGLELILVYRQSARRWLSHPPGGRLPLLSTRPTVTFPDCLVTEAHGCEQLAQGCYEAFAPSKIWTLLIASSMLYPLRHLHNIHWIITKLNYR